jgi:hypothetical protein
VIFEIKVEFKPEAKEGDNKTRRLEKYNIFF